MSGCAFPALLAILVTTVSGCGGGGANGSVSGNGQSATGAGVAATAAAGAGGAGTAGQNAAPAGGAVATPSIAAIQISGPAVKVYDHLTDQQEADSIPDAQISAWREANGMVSIMIPSTEAYRMRGADLLHLAIDPNKIYSSASAGSQIAEASHNDRHWLMGPYSSDGVNFYSVSHSEWYACLLNANCGAATTNGIAADYNSWTNTLNDFASSDGGAHWQLNVSAGSHVVADAAYHWTGSVALSSQAYLHAFNHSGIFQPSHLVQEGSWWYCVASYIHRDFTQINPAAGIYQAPVDRDGYVLLRTSDFTNPNAWQAWTGGTSYSPVANQNFQTFLPMQNGVALGAASPQLLYDRMAKVYVLFHTVFGGSHPIYYLTTGSLAAPAWSDTVAVAGTAAFTSDPAGPVQGFNDTNYPSVLDPASPGYNFEFINGSPWLFYNTSPSSYGGSNLARDIYRVPLSVTYAPAP